MYLFPEPLGVFSVALIKMYSELQPFDSAQGPGQSLKVGFGSAQHKYSDCLGLAFI